MDGRFRGSGTAQIPNLYRKPSEAEMAGKAPEVVSWTQLAVLVGLLGTLAIAVIGGGFAWCMVI